MVRQLVRSVVTALALLNAKPLMAAGNENIALMRALAVRESNGNYGVVNSLGYLGAYQFGEPALVDLGFYAGDPTPDVNDWTGGWTGKVGVHSRDDFLASVAAQDQAMREWLDLLWRYATHSDLRLDVYVGRSVNGIPITQSGVLAGAHLVGIFGVAAFLRSNGAEDTLDPFGVPVSEYVRTFAAY
jgi:hypothetical protein